MNEQKTILVIDDDKKFSFGLATLLRRAGFQILIANNGEEGIRVIRASKPDVILCDIMMPPPNGMQLKKELMADPQTNRIPFLFLTARTAPIDKITGLESGADDYITKPFGIDELMARINSVLRRDHLGHERGVQETFVALEQLRNSLSTNVSHELRTPMKDLLATLDLVVHSKLVESNDELSRHLMKINKSAYRIEFLIEDLEMLYDMDHKQINTLHETIDLQLNFKTPIMQIFKNWEDKQLDLQITIHPDVTLCAPRSGFSHVMSHLVDNACKFSPQSGRIEVLVEPNGIGGGIIDVKDEGDGISSGLREKVFERYYQINRGSSRKYSGLGIGLTIARAFVQSIGGEIQVMDSPIGCHIRMILQPLYPRASSPYVVKTQKSEENNLKSVP